MALAELRPVFEPREGNGKISALNRLLERRPRCLHEDGLAAESLRDHSRYLDVEPADYRRICRIRFDERCAAFRVSTPAKHRFA